MSINRKSLSARATSQKGVRQWVTNLKHRLSDDRGDVPGWVLITLMTAGIVVALWAVASDALVGLFQQAMAQFT